MNQIRESSPQPRARLTGAIYLLYFVTAILAQTLLSQGYAQTGKVINVFASLCYFAVTILFYLLFKPVSRVLSLLAALFSLGGCVDMSLDLIHVDSQVSPLWFFGPFCLLIGYLVFRSGFLPRALGIALAVAGVGWLAFLLPNLPHFLTTAIMVIGFTAELALCLWLVVRGVKVERWRLLAIPV